MQSNIYSTLSPMSYPLSTVTSPESQIQISTASPQIEPPHSYYQHQDGHLQTRRIGIERLDGLLLNGKNDELYEINVEAPETIQDVYDDLQTFVHGTNVSEGLEAMILDTFIEGDCDDDDEIVQWYNEHENLPLSHDVLLHPSLYPKKLQERAYRQYTLIRAQDYLLKHCSAEQIKQYDNYKRQLYIEYQQYQQKFGHLLKSTDPSSHQQSIEPQHHPLLTTPMYDQSQQQPSPILLHAPDRQLLEYDGFNDIQTPVQYDPYKNQQQQQLPPPFKSKITPPKLPTDVLNALCYRPNNHNMYCLTIRNVTNTFNNNQQLQQQQQQNDEESSSSSLTTNNTTTTSDTCDSQCHQDNQHGVLEYKFNNKQLSHHPKQQQQQQQHENQYSDEKHGLLSNSLFQKHSNDVTVVKYDQKFNSNVYGVVFCQLVTVDTVLEQVNKQPLYNIDALAQYVSDNIKVTNEPPQQEDVCHQNNNAIQHDISNEQNNSKTILKPSPCHNTFHQYTPSHFQNIPEANAEEIKYFLQQAALQHHKSNLIIEDITNDEEKDGDKEGISNNNTNNSLHKECYTDLNSNKCNTTNDVQNEEFVCYYPLVPVPEEEEEEEKEMVIESLEAGPEHRLDNLTTPIVYHESQQHNNINVNDNQFNSKNNYQQNTNNPSSTTTTTRPTAQQIKSNMTQYHWVKIELISIHEQHRSKGVGNLLFLSALLAATLSQRFKTILDQDVMYRNMYGTNYDHDIFEPASIRHQNNNNNNKDEDDDDEDTKAITQSIGNLSLDVSPEFNDNGQVQDHQIPSHLSLLSPYPNQLLTTTTTKTKQNNTNTNNTHNNSAAATSHRSNVNNALLSLAGGKAKNPAGHKVYTEKNNFVPVPPDYMRTKNGNPYKDVYVLVQINKLFKKIRWGELIAGIHNVE